MPSVHRKPTPDEQATTLAVLDALARSLGYPGIRTYGAGRGLARALNVHSSAVCQYATGRRAMSAATVAAWRARAHSTPTIEDENV